MVSNVGYARLPRIGFRSTKGLLGTGVHVLLIWFAIADRDIFFFPLGIAYIAYGVLRWVALAFLDRGEDSNGDDQPELVLHPQPESTSGDRSQQL